VAALICTVDVVLMTLKDSVLQVALLKRTREPYEGVWALPGGYVHVEEDANTDAAARRVLREKMGVVSPYLEQLETFSGKFRDHRGWSISVAYFALVPAQLIDETSESIRWVPADQLEPLPFDHNDIVRAALVRIRSKSSYSSLPVFLCGDVFTIPELHKVYELVKGSPINMVSFRRKMDELDMLEAVETVRTKGMSGKPPTLYRIRPEFKSALSTSHRGFA
jgi:8-oxo-dGTP diphosphatase